MTTYRLGGVTAALTALVMLGTPTQAVGDEAAWVWPLQPIPTIAAAFAPPDEVWQSGHRGVDLLGSHGQSVFAIGPGRVTFAASLAGRGVVVVDHGELRSTYEPVLAQVAVGERMVAGQPVGLLQSVHSHCAPMSCLHLGLKRGEAYLDPLAVLPDRDVRLKPLDGQVVQTLSLDAAAGGIQDAAGGHPLPGPSHTSRASDSESRLTSRSILGGAAAVTATMLAAGLRRRPQARG